MGPQGCLFLENCHSAWRGFMQGSSLPGARLLELEPPQLVWYLFFVFRVYSGRQSLFHLTTFSPSHCPRRERSEGKPGFVLKPHVNKWGSKDPSVLCFFVFEPGLWTQTCFEYCRLWVWLCKSIEFWIFKALFHNSCRGMKLQGKQKYSPPTKTICTKQSLSAGGLWFTGICSSSCPEDVSRHSSFSFKSHLQWIGVYSSLPKPVCVRLCVYPCVPLCVYPCVPLCVYAHMCACVFLCSCVYTCVCVCMRACVCLRVYLCVCLCVCAHMCLCVHLCVLGVFPHHESGEPTTVSCPLTSRSPMLRQSGRQARACTYIQNK